MRGEARLILIFAILSQSTVNYWLTAKIYNINNNIEAKVIVIFKGKLKSARGLLVYLVVIVILYKVLNYLNINFIAYLLKNPK